MITVEIPDKDLYAVQLALTDIEEIWRRQERRQREVNNCSTRLQQDHIQSISALRWRLSKEGK